MMCHCGNKCLTKCKAVKVRLVIDIASVYCTLPCSPRLFHQLRKAMWESLGVPNEQQTINQFKSVKIISPKVLFIFNEKSVNRTAF